MQWGKCERLGACSYFVYNLNGAGEVEPFGRYVCLPETPMSFGVGGGFFWEPVKFLMRSRHGGR
jgi:hypothetical protein